MDGNGKALNSCRVIGTPERSLALDPLSGPLRSLQRCIARFHTITACSKVDLPLLFGPANNVTVSKGKI